MSSSGNNTPSTSAKDNTNNNNNNEIIPMETPPSSPPSSSRKPSGGTDDDDARATTSPRNATTPTNRNEGPSDDDANDAATLADILPESSNRAVDDSLEAEGRCARHTRHARTATPSTPVPFDAYDAHAEPSHPHQQQQQQQYSTPNRGRLDGTGGTASNNNNNNNNNNHNHHSRHPQAAFYQACQASHVADLTPIISNNSGGYADANATSVARSGECEIGIPNMPPAMPPGGRMMMGSASSSSSSSSSSSKNALSERPRSTFGSFAREKDMALVLPKDERERYRVRDVAHDDDGDVVVPSSGARGLRQRRLPPPRAGLPPAKRSSIEGIEGGATADVVDAADDGGVATAVANSSNAGLSSRNATTTDNNNNNNHASGGEGREGHDSLANLLGERLAMPSYDDEDGSSSVEGGGNGPAGAVGAARTATTTTTRKDTRSIFEGGERFGRDDDDDDDNNMAPVELQPDRKFFSFQGVSQYRRRVVDGSAPSSSGTTPSAPEGGISSATSPSRARRPPAPLDKEDGRSSTLSTSARRHQRRQYQPMSRNRHGVKEMADAEDLDAIFKAPRNEGTRVVTPFASPAHGDRPSSSQLQSFGFQMAKEAQRPSLLRMAREEEAVNSTVENGATIDDAERRNHHHSLASPYPVESQWSIPSIRLANHVDQTSSSGGIGYGGGHPADSFASYADCSEYTDDDESFYSFLEDDEASLDDNSRGSARMTTTTRRRRLSGIFQLRRGTSSEEEKVAPPPPSSGASRSTPSFDAGVDDVGGIAGAVPTTTTTTTTASTAGPSIVPPSPGIAPSNSFAERVRDISIIGTAAASASDVKVATVHSMNDAVVVLSHPPALSRRAHTFDSEAPPPILDVDDDDAATPPTIKADDDAADEYSRPRWHHRGTRNRRDAAGGRGGGGGRNRRARKEGAAVEWLAELQVRSQGVSSESGGGEYLIAEAASSKFLSVGAGRLDGAGGGGLGGGRRSDASSMAMAMASEGVAKALGMPHPLCRSSTIEAGSFVNRAEGAFGSRNADVGGGVALGSTNSIALTSSGSGD